MDPTLMLMDIKGQKVLVKLFTHCNYVAETNTLTNGRNQTLYGEPAIMNRGPDQTELHVMMSWGPHNMSSIGTVEGRIDPTSGSLHVYNEELLGYMKSKQTEVEQSEAEGEQSEAEGAEGDEVEQN